MIDETRGLGGLSALFARPDTTDAARSQGSGFGSALGEAMDPEPAQSMTGTGSRADARPASRTAADAQAETAQSPSRRAMLAQDRSLQERRRAAGSQDVRADQRNPARGPAETDAAQRQRRLGAQQPQADKTEVSSQARRAQATETSAAQATEKNGPAVSAAASDANPYAGVTPANAVAVRPLSAEDKADDEATEDSQTIAPMAIGQQADTAGMAQGAMPSGALQAAGEVQSAGVQAGATVAADSGSLQAGALAAGGANTRSAQIATGTSNAGPGPGVSGTLGRSGTEASASGQSQSEAMGALVAQAGRSAQNDAASVNLEAMQARASGATTGATTGTTAGPRMETAAAAAGTNPRAEATAANFLASGGGPIQLSLESGLRQNAAGGRGASPLSGESAGSATEAGSARRNTTGQAEGRTSINTLAITTTAVSFQAASLLGSLQEARVVSGLERATVGAETSLNGGNPALAPLLASPASIALGPDAGAGATAAEATQLHNPHPLDSAEFQEQLASQVSESLLAGLDRAEISLSPPELGPIRIRLSLAGESADIAFSAVLPETRTAIEQSLPVLRDMLSEQGLQLGQAQISGGDAGAWAGGQPGGSFQGFAQTQQGGSSAPTASDLGTRTGTAGRPDSESARRPQGLLDLFA